MNYCDHSGHFAISTIIALVVIGLAAVSTVATITYEAVTETPIVLDLSISGGMGDGVGVKAGISVVSDFKNKSFGFYPHLGYFYGVKWNAFGISYSTGIVRNYVH